MYICHMNAFDTEDLYAESNHDIVGLLGKEFRSYRLALRLTQKEVAERAGISVMTLVRFESGESSSLSLVNYLSLLRVIRKLETIMDTIPEMPDSLYVRRKKAAPQRVRRRKNEA
ncbi:MAG: helix-turn-helix transcriptional regulator [Bacteroidales bacterium]|nr:helix-turn-helix transcriptional regulator [Bacteroidales bacterium]